jgi:hypothetical protein
MFGGPVALAETNDGAADRFDPAPRMQVLLPAVVRQLQAFPSGTLVVRACREPFAPAATSARPQTDDETR